MIVASVKLAKLDKPGPYHISISQLLSLSQPDWISAIIALISQIDNEITPIAFNCVYCFCSLYCMDGLGVSVHVRYIYRTLSP